MDKEINIYRVRVIAYLVCAGLLIGLLLTCVWIFLWFILRFWLGWLLPLIVLYICGVACFAVTWVKVLRYGLTDAALLINKGIWFKSRKTIPLDKITDLEFIQGPLLRFFGMWIIKVQTAGTGSQMPVAMLIGVRSPEQIREEILAAKTAYHKG
jgi:membrane protein YdbS with pleckstrin-like domain